MAVKREAVRVEDFTPISALVKAYEFKPGHAYLVVCDVKKFSIEKARSLFRDILEKHPDVEIAVVATSTPEAVEIREKVKPTEQEAQPEPPKELFPTE